MKPNPFCTPATYTCGHVVSFLWFIHSFIKTHFVRFQFSSVQKLRSVDPGRSIWPALGFPHVRVPMDHGDHGLRPYYPRPPLSLTLLALIFDLITSPSRLCHASAFHHARCPTPRQQQLPPLHAHVHHRTQGIVLNFLDPP